MTTATPHPFAPTARAVALETLQGLRELSEQWPEHARVRHVNGWIGTIVDGDSLRFTAPISVLGNSAHTLLWPSDHPRARAVCVAHEIDGIPVIAWYRPHVLRRVETRQ